MKNGIVSLSPTYTRTQTHLPSTSLPPCTEINHNGFFRLSFICEQMDMALSLPISWSKYNLLCITTSETTSRSNVLRRVFPVTQNLGEFGRVCAWLCAVPHHQMFQKGSSYKYYYYKKYRASKRNRTYTSKLTKKSAIAKHLPKNSSTDTRRK